jgi:acetyl esterase
MNTQGNGAVGLEMRVQGMNAPLRATLWRAAEKADLLIVFLHGGNFVSEDSAELDNFFRKLGSLPSLAILAPRYTLATESPFPTPLEDAVSVLQWTEKNKGKLGWTGATLIVAGIEAGANLAAAAALVNRDRRGARLAAQILLMPMLDPALGSRSMREADGDGHGGRSSAAHRCASGYQDYLPNVADRMHPYATPLYSSRLKDLPPTLIFSVDGDPLRDEGEAYGVKLIEQGVRTSVVRLPAIALEARGARGQCASSRQVIGEISSFLNALSSSPHPTTQREPS